MTGKMEDRATTMVAWFESLPDYATPKSDGEIAVVLHRISPKQGWVTFGAITGNVAQVRQVRRWIDRQKSGEFAGYQFNTRRTGSGQSWVHLRTKTARLLSATIGTQAQVQSAEQFERRTAEERGRIVLKLQAESEEWFQLGDFARCVACSDGATEYDSLGRFSAATKQRFERLGLRTP